MRSAQQWFAEYGESHQNPINKSIHWIAVPVIYATVAGLLWDIPQPQFMAIRANYGYFGLPIFHGHIFRAMAFKHFAAYRTIPHIVVSVQPQKPRHAALRQIMLYHFLGGMRACVLIGPQFS